MRLLSWVPSAFGADSSTFAVAGCFHPGAGMTHARRSHGGDRVPRDERLLPGARRRLVPQDTPRKKGSAVKLVWGMQEMPPSLASDRARRLRPAPGSPALKSLRHPTAESGTPLGARGCARSHPGVPRLLACRTLFYLIPFPRNSCGPPWSLREV